MKTMKRTVSLLICAVMVATTVFGAGLASLLNAKAATITIDGISQQRVVDNYEATYASYAEQFFLGSETNGPTNMVIPGLSPTDNYIPQGMTYYAAKNWMLISAYDNSTSKRNSLIYALDMASGDFVALFKLQNADGSTNSSHGGGIAASEYNFYYADSASKISYIPLSEFDVPVGTSKYVKLAGSVDLKGELNGASTSYCSYGDGVLWTGNFFYAKNTSYDTKANVEYDSMILGYKLKGSSSAEEWNNINALVGNPTYCIGTVDDRIQYAAVCQGKLYLSRSWDRSKTGANHIRELVISDIDINTPGSTVMTVNNIQRQGFVLNDTTANTLRYNGNQMFSMNEAVCVANNYLYMFPESSAYKYNGGEDTRTEDPIDVLWKIDQQALINERRDDDDSVAEKYQKVNSLSDITPADEYIIVYESSQTDSSTGNKILYALDSYGGYDSNKLPKQDDVTQAYTGDSMGLIGHKITNYTVNGDELIITAADDARKSIRWTLTGADSNSLKMINNDQYYFTNKYLYFGSRLFSMSTELNTDITNIKLEGSGGDFRFYYNGTNRYYLWCNDGSDQSLINSYTSYYSSNNPGFAVNYSGLTEQAGTFHADASGSAANTGNITGSAISDSLQIMHIYKRVAAESITDGNVFYTDDQGMHTSAKAVLQPDGTYTLKIDAFSTENYQYQVESRDSDILYLVDASSSMKLLDTLTLRSFSGSEVLTVGAMMLNNNGTWNQYSTKTELAKVGELYYGSGKCTEVIELYNDQYPYFIFDQNSGNFYRLNISQCSPNWDYTSWFTHYCDCAWWLYYRDEAGLCHMVFKSAAENKINARLSAFKDTIRNAGITLTDDDLTGHGDGTSAVDPKGISFEVLSWFVKNASNSGTYKYDHDSGSNNMITTDDCNNKSKKYDDLGGTNLLTSTDVTNVQNSGYKLFCLERTDSGNRRNRMTLAYNYLQSQIYKLDSNDAVQLAYFGDGITTSFNSSGFVYRETAISNNLINYKDDGYANYNDAQFSSSNALGLTGALTTIKNAIDDNGKVISKYGPTGNRTLSIVIVTDGDYDTPDESNLLAIAETLKKDYGVKIYTQKLGPNSTDGYKALLQSVSSDNMTSVRSSQEWTSVSDCNIHSTFGCNKEDISNLTGASVVRFNINDDSDAMRSVIKYGSTFRTVKLNAADKVTVEYDTSKFIIPDNPQFTTKEATKVSSVTDSNYISTATFNAPVDYNGNVSVTKSGSTITISGYDWSSANKLTVEIKGLLPLENISLATPENTVIGSKFYDDSLVIKSFGNTASISIPEVAYVADFGVNMSLNNNGGTAFGVASTPKSFANGYETETSTASADFSIDSGVAKIALTSSEDFSDASSYVFAQKGNGDYEWKKVTIVPASNVLYEESSPSLEFDGSGATQWGTVGTTSTAGQSISTSNDVYGYDDAYNNTNQYSNGSALTATVDSTNKKSDKATFKFTGTGFDLVSACGPNTGVEVITVKQGTEIKKVFIIDTYYNDSTYGTLYQVPIASYSDAYGTYTVETTAAYLSFAGALNQGTVQTASIDGTEIEASSAQLDAATASELLAQLGMEELAGEDVEVIWMDDNSIFNGGTGAQGSTVSTQAAGDSDISLVSYIDGFRIYNPLTDEQAAKYYPASEQGAEYYNIIGSLTSGNGNISGDANNWLAYVEGGNGTFGFGDYKSNGGPKNEVYLDESSNNGLVFSFRVNQSKINQAKAMISVRAASGNPTVQILGQTVSLVSSTEMYIDITKFIGDKFSDSTVVTTDGDDYVITVSIKNIGGGLLAVDNLKLVNCSTEGVSTQSIEQVNALMSMAPSNYSLDGIIGMGGRAPSAPNSGADPDLDPEGEINPEPEQPNAIDAVLNRIVTFLQNVFEFVKTAFVKFIGFFNLLKF